MDTPRDDPDTAAQLTALEDAVRETPGIASVAPALPSEDGEMATIFATPTTSPQDARTSDLLATLRSDVIPDAVGDTPLRVYVGGNTAGFGSVVGAKAGSPNTSKEPLTGRCGRD